MSDLARELVRHPRWRWAPGMLIADYGPGIRYCWQDETYLHGAAEPGGAWMRIPKSRIGDGPYLPDLTDAATAGCVLALLPYPPRIERVDDPHRTPSTLWFVAPSGGGPWHQGPTLGEAAARALMACEHWRTT